MWYKVGVPKNTTHKEEVGIATEALMQYEGPEREIRVGDFVMTRSASKLGRLLVTEIVGSKAILVSAPYADEE